MAVVGKELPQPTRVMPSKVPDSTLLKMAPNVFKMSQPSWVGKKNSTIFSEQEDSQEGPRMLLVVTQASDK